MFFHELAHVDADHGIGTVEQELGQGLAQFGLADAGRAEEQEGTVRPVRVGQAGTRAADGRGHRGHRLVLADDLAVQIAFHTQQFFTLAFQHLADRNAGPARYHFRDFVSGHFILQELEAMGFDRHGRAQLLFQFRNAAILDLAHQGDVLLALRGIELKTRLFQLLLDAGGSGQRGFFGLPDFLQIAELALELVDFLLEIVQTLFGFAVFFLFQGFALHLELDQAALHAVHFLRLGVDLHADARCRFVHQIDGFVGQLPVGDVTVRQRRRRHDGRVGDFDAVVHGVTLFQTAQNGDGVLHRGLADEHFLESALERGILLHVLAVLIERGGADAVQFTAGQRRFQHVAGIHGAFALAGTDHGVQLVNEQDDIAFLLRQIAQHRLQALFELAAVFGAGNQRTHVEREHAPATQAFGHFVVDDALGQAFDDGGLAHAGFADQHRIVLGAALQHLDGAADFLVAADDRIKLAAFGTRGQVDAVLLQSLPVFLGIGIGHRLAAAQSQDGLLELGFIGAGGFQGAPGRTAVAGNGQQKPFAGDELILMLLRQFVGLVEQARQFVADRHLAVLTGDFRQLIQGLAEFLFQDRQIDAGLAQHRQAVAALLVDQCRKQMDRLDQAVVTADGQALGIAQSLLEFAGEFIDTHAVPLSWIAPQGA